jgi:hypothetical protein
MSVSPSSELQGQWRGRPSGGSEAGPIRPLQVIGFGLGLISQFQGSLSGLYGRFLRCRGSLLSEIHFNFAQFNPTGAKKSRKRPYYLSI